MNKLALILAAMAAGCAVLLAVPPLVSMVRKRLPAGSVKSHGQGLIRRWANKLAPQLPPRWVAMTDKRILMAGGMDGLSAEFVALSSVAFSLLSFFFGVIVALATLNPIWPVLFGLGGLLLPSLWLNDRVKQRHAVILRHLPFHLDLLTLSVEAGMDFTAALAKMVEKGKIGPLREEFNYTLSQMRVGVSRGQALRDMATRVDLPQLTTFLSSLVQADKLGMSLGKVLRVQSETVRTERSQRAEKRANEAPVRILIPLMIFIFPTIWIILFAPIVFSFAF